MSWEWFQAWFSLKIIKIIDLKMAETEWEKKEKYCIINIKPKTIWPNNENISNFHVGSTNISGYKHMLCNKRFSWLNLIWKSWSKDKLLPKPQDSWYKNGKEMKNRIAKQSNAFTKHHAPSSLSSLIRTFWVWISLDRILIASFN